MREWLLVCLLIFAQNTLFSANREGMLHHLSTIETIFRDRYAPFAWKKEFLNWTLKEAKENAKAQIKAASLLTVKDYQRILKSFFQSFRDYHVSAVFYSTEKAALPFQVQNAGHKYIVTSVQDETLAAMVQDGRYIGDELIAPGCQILKFDRMPIRQVIKELIRNEFNNIYSNTHYLWANDLLTMRLGSFGHRMPAQCAEVQFRLPSGKVIDANLAWIHTAEELLYKSRHPSEFEQKLAFKTHMLSPLAEALQINNISHVEPEQKDIPELSYPLKPRLQLGKIIWQEDEPSIYSAYIYTLPNSNKNIGYLRIHTYGPSEVMSEVNALVEKLAYIINYFEENTAALVVDQVDNPGGLVLYAYAVASLLTDRPLDTPLHRFTLTHREVSEQLTVRQQVLEALANEEELTSSLFFGYPCERSFFEQALDFANFIIAEWNQGKTLTSKFPLHGISKICPHPLGSYSKPLVMLINAKDFSGADFIPAILQDNKRAKLFGEQTAGAGGCVEMCSFPNLFGVNYFSYTSSFAERLSGAPLENLGVLPDIHYKIKEIDLLNNYSSYIKALNAALKYMLEEA